MDKFLSCDWGTSFFRLRLIQFERLNVIAEEKNDRGIANTFRQWKDEGAVAEKRRAFFQAVISENIQILSKRLDLDLTGIPVIISGMISSSIGMIELPYKETPAAIDGSDLSIKKLAIEEGDHEFIIVSGIKTDRDVIRGEETKVVGCAFFLPDTKSEKLLIFTGTHPKHVTIQNQHIVNIKTYMTGEFFSLLGNYSVLAASIKATKDFYKQANQESFEAGVKDSLNSNLLHSAFWVRTNDILRNIPAENNFYYLSGLLIGTELKGLLNYEFPVYLCGGVDLIPYYKLACETLGITVAMQIDADEALLKGQKQLYSMYIGGKL